MYTDSSILQQMKEQQGIILDTDYTKVDINKMVSGLDTTRNSKKVLVIMLKKVPKLFGGGLGLLEIKPMSNKFKEESKLYQGHYYSIQKGLQITNKDKYRHVSNNICLVKVILQQRFAVGSTNVHITKED